MSVPRPYSCVLDASALLALLHEEPGAGIVEPLLEEAVISRACYGPVPRTAVACWRKRQANATKCNPAKVVGSLS